MTVPRSRATLRGLRRAGDAEHEQDDGGQEAGGREVALPAGAAGRDRREQVDAGEAHGVLLALRAGARCRRSARRTGHDEEDEPPRIEERHPATAPAVVAARWAKPSLVAGCARSVLMSATQSRSVASTRWLAPAARTAVAMASWRAWAASA